MTPSDVSVPDAPDVRRYARLGRKRLRVGWTRFALSVAPSPESLDPDLAIEGLPQSPHVLVLCLGNICRSPLAERYLRAEADDRGIDGLTVDSGGFVETEGRSSPPHAVEAAADCGVDLGDHRSTLVTTSDLRRSDVVFLMDAYNYALLGERFDGHRTEAYFLGTFTEGGGYEIDDPYRGDAAACRDVYREVTDAVDGFLDRLEADRR